MIVEANNKQHYVIIAISRKWIGSGEAAAFPFHCAIRYFIYWRMTLSVLVSAALYRERCSLWMENVYCSSLHDSHLFFVRIRYMLRRATGGEKAYIQVYSKKKMLIENDVYFIVLCNFFFLSWKRANLISVNGASSIWYSNKAYWQRICV